MWHDRRGFQLDWAGDLDELVEKLTEHTWCRCQGFFLWPLMMLNDSTGPDGAQEYAVILEDRPRGGFSIRVIDDGPGIPPEELVRLPERRFRGKAARTRHPEGTGLGLDIARDVADRHGLTLDFRASEYSGLEAELHGGAAEA